MRSKSQRLPWLLWIAGVALFFANWLFPVSSRLTRITGIMLLFVVWFGLIALLWRFRGARFSFLAVTGLLVGFLALPQQSSRTALREDYIVGLKRYEGVTYYWGGESYKGIDCSGLIRRGLIEAAFWRGCKSFSSALIRYAIWLWWNDCTAENLGEDNNRMTLHLLDTPAINQLDHSRILPGDLAVTASGVHIMAYLGSNYWIEADPLAHRVITISAPCETNAWFIEPMKIMRWNVLQSQ